MSITLETVLNSYKTLPQVQAIAIGGSSIAHINDNLSDIDIEIFSSEPIPLQARENIAKSFSSKMDLNQDYFGPTDEYVVDDLGVQLDIAYWDVSWIENEVESKWEQFNASNGYTTCILYTIKNCKLFYDKNNWLKNLKQRLNTPYPDELAKSIIYRNMQLMNGKPFASYLEQIDKAMIREDYNSVNHRLTAFMASYFDVIFAKNRMLHPGEKRLVKYALENCSHLPTNFEEDVTNILASTYDDTLKVHLLNLLMNLRRFIEL